MSHNSPRSLRTKTEARQRPDEVWCDNDGSHEIRLDGSSSQSVLSGGTALAQLVAEADAHLAAMRKIVH